jgi:putative SOS response-associated peptidase YedK
MCSQFESAPAPKIAKYFPTISKYPEEDKALGTHIYPFAKAPVIVKKSGENEIVHMNYSLIPSWSKTPKPKFSTYNARLDRIGANDQLELIYNSPTWKVPFKRQHCIVALNGFYESCRSGSHLGNIVKFSTVDPDEILLAAGIWDKWVDSSTGEIIYSFSIITDEPTQFILDVGHDRQPVFMSLEKSNAWLNNENTDPSELYNFLKNNQKPVTYKVNNFKKLKGFEKNDLFS